MFKKKIKTPLTILNLIMVNLLFYFFFSSAQLLELREVQRRYLEDIKINELHTEEQKSKINSEKKQDVEHINKHNEVVLEEKAALIINLPLEQIVSQ